MIGSGVDYEACRLLLLSRGLVPRSIPHCFPFLTITLAKCPDPVSDFYGAFELPDELDLVKNI